MELTILQTSDAFKYRRMLTATSRTVVEYCRRHGFAYESFTGIKRGFHGAQAAFNRIFMLEDLFTRGYRGWALYMDADAYIYDLDFDLRAYLADKQGHSAIMATIPGEAIPWHINSGVLFFNLGHPQAIALILEWKSRFMIILDEELRELHSVWDGRNDQDMLYWSLHEQVELRETVLFVDAALFNHHEGRFVRQLLNSLESDLDKRTAKIEAATNFVLRGLPGDEQATAKHLVNGLYRAILGRDADPGSQGYVNLIVNAGMADGTSAVVSALLDSAEYSAKRF